MDTNLIAIDPKVGQALDASYQNSLLQTIPPMDMAALHRYFFDLGAKAQREITPVPAVIIDLNSGLVSTRSNVAVRIVILDDDVEGVDDFDRLGEIEGCKAFITDYVKDGADQLEDVLREVDQHWIDVAADAAPVQQEGTL